MNRILRDSGFRTHLIVYAAVNAGLVIVNVMAKPEHYWFYWPLIGWGVGLLVHAFLVSRKPDVTAMSRPTTRPDEPPSSPPR